MQEPLVSILGVLETTPARWTSMAGSIPGESFMHKPLPGEWSAFECLLHTLDTERLFQSRLKAFMAGQDFPAFNPDEQGSKPAPTHTPASLAAEFETLRAASLVEIRPLNTADLQRKVRHQELGQVTLLHLLNEWAGHDFIHMMQAERALMQPYIECCGPWHIYFEEHRIIAAK